MHRFALLALLLLAAVPTFAEEKPPETPTPATEIPKGELLKFTFDKSKVFPGTTRDYTVYVPKQYDPAKPACVFICQDGVLFNAPAQLDKLIAAKDIPIVIGVFSTPGVIKPVDDKKALPRFNRSYEYDGLGDAFARFLIDELLPDVETKTTADGRAIKLSKDGNDRCIAGASSGAVCAFTAAWERPKEFSRVFSAIGTYVGLRGAHTYMNLVRKIEPKPLRIFLQDGSKDLNIYGGDWWIGNQEMERALTYAGYEVNHAFGEGGHEHKQAAEVFQDAMRWLWKDWPAPIKTGNGSKQLQEIRLPGEDWQLVGEGYKFTEGTIANAKGEVFFNDIPNNKLFKVGLDGKVTTVTEDSKKANGIAFGPDGKMYVVAGGAEQIHVYDEAGKVSILSEGIKGNDITVRFDGKIYVTVPGGQDAKENKVVLINAKGEKTDVDTGIKFPNGIALSPDQTLLYVAESRSHWIYSFVIQPDGTLAYKQKFYHLHAPDSADDAWPDGMRVDRDGRLYVTTRMGIQICDQAGRVLVILPTPNGKAANCCFGGAEFDTLFVAAGDKVFKRKLKVKGVNAFEAPILPKGPKL